MMIPVSLDEKRTAQQQMWEHATPYFESWDPCNTLSALIEQAGAQVTLECSKLTAECHRCRTQQAYQLRHQLCRTMRAVLQTKAL